MAWLQNLAGKAEDLLNKIDKNAATVFNEKVPTSLENVETESFTLNNNLIVDIPEEIIQQGSKLEIFNEDIVSDNSEKLMDLDDNQKIVHDSKLSEDEANLNWTQSTLSSKSGSMQNSFICDDKSVEQIAKLEMENQILNQQLINLQHTHSELQNEYVNLTNQLRIANEVAESTQSEMEQYKSRAQRILQEKEKLISLKNSENTSDMDTDNNQILTSYIEELKKEVEFQHTVNKELSEKLNCISMDLLNVQDEFRIAQNRDQSLIRDLQASVASEKKIRSTLEEECHSRNKELQRILRDHSNMQNIIDVKDQEIEQLKISLKQKLESNSQTDFGDKYHSLTETLMLKQSSLEAVTTERNALRLQLERLENEYHKIENQVKKQVVQLNDQVEVDARPDIPTLMRISPFDQGVTRRVKTAYSTLDAVSIRTGAFLRRYPVARIFVLCYMVLLHIWVLVILWTYVPTSIEPKRL